MSEEVITPQTGEISLQSAMLQKKRMAWADMGEAVHKKEMALQVQAQSAIQKLHLPKSIAEIPEAETLLKELKQEQKNIEASRKELTGKFDELTARLMKPEKSLSSPIYDLAQAIISLKVEDEVNVQKERNKIDEIKRVKEATLNRVANIEAQFLTKISNMVNKAYEHALGEGNIHPDNLPLYLRRIEEKLDVFDFSEAGPKFPAAYCTQETIDATITEHFKLKSPLEYIQLFKSQLREKFSDYDVAHTNKAQALALAKQEEVEREKEIQEGLNNTMAAQRLDSLAEDAIVISTTTKALKKAYEVDMDETVHSAMAILAAFVANASLCLPKLQVKKWFSFTPAQAAAALSKVKCDDPNFQPTGIIFKAVDKL